MRQTLHIFRKDVRFLWPQIALTLAMTAFFAWSYSLSSLLVGLDPETVRGWSAFLLLVAYWFLIASAIHKERPQGDRRFWLTRPYSWKSIVAAKALLTFTFISIPFLISDVTILRAQGISIWSGGLWQRQCALAAFVLLPLAAVSAVARNVMQIVLPAVAFVVAVAFEYDRLDFPDWGAVAWIQFAAIGATLFIATAGACLWQYARRRTAPSLAILSVAAAACFGLLIISPPRAALAIQYRSPADSAIRLTLAHDEVGRDIAITNHETMRFASTDGTYDIRIDGVAPDTEAHVDIAAIEIDGQSSPWRSEWRTSGHRIPKDAGFDWMQGMDGRVYVIPGRELTYKLNEQSARATLSLAFTVYRRETATLLNVWQFQSIEGIGWCRILMPHAVACSVPALQSVGIEIQHGFSRTPLFPPGFALYYPGPSATVAWNVPESGQPDDAPVELDIERPIAHILRTLQLK